MAAFGWFARVRDLTLALTRVPSVTETPGERTFADHIAALLRENHYFAQHPQHVRVLDTPGDPFARRNVFALLPATSGTAGTVLLAGHYDVVSTANYGPLETVACDPVALAPALRDLLCKSANPADLEALRDLETGEWMPGRGALDMKSGLAVGMAVLERLATQPNRSANVLMMFTPDEENYSRGMRGAVQQLHGLCSEWNLNPALSINLDAAVNTGASTDARAIYLGSVGKLLPFACFIGRPTHAGAPFDGVSAALMAAEFVRHVEASPGMGDATPTEGEYPPVPVVLRSIDLKPGYDVTTPSRAFVALNVLTYNAAPDEVLTRVRAAAGAALGTVQQLLGQRARALAHASGRAVQFATAPAQVMDVRELRARSGAINTADTASDDVLAATCRAVTAMLSQADVPGPAGIIGFAPIYYPVAPPVDAALRTRLQGLAASVHADGGHNIGVRPFFTGISDMSFLGANIGHETLAFMEAQSPQWHARWAMTSPPFNAPVINIGPWGRDYHQRNERVHMPYSFDTVPELVWRVIMSTP